MAIATTSNSNTNVTTQALMDSVNGTKKTTTSTINDAEDRFLKLLTTQLKNQDPLNPMDNAEMTSQLAQISTVDGIEKLNATLQKMMTSTVDAEVMQAASMVGRNVMVAGSGLQLTDAGAVSAVKVDAFADKVVVTIKDSNGLSIRTLNLGDLDAGVHNFTWDGKNDAGAAAVAGNYSISVAATNGADKVASTALQLAQVQSVSRSATGTTLDVGSLGQVAMSDVKQIF
jgi:flagellar basal-body rod modification protein FlgD